MHYPRYPPKSQLADNQRTPANPVFTSTNEGVTLYY